MLQVDGSRKINFTKRHLVSSTEDEEGYTCPFNLRRNTRWSLEDQGLLLTATEGVAISCQTFLCLPIGRPNLPTQAPSMPYPLQSGTTDGTAVGVFFGLIYILFSYLRNTRVEVFFPNSNSFGHQDQVSAKIPPGFHTGSPRFQEGRTKIPLQFSWCLWFSGADPSWAVKRFRGGFHQKNRRRLWEHSKEHFGRRKPFPAKNLRRQTCHLSPGTLL